MSRQFIITVPDHVAAYHIKDILVKYHKKLKIEEPWQIRLYEMTGLHLAALNLADSIESHVATSLENYE